MAECSLHCCVCCCLDVCCTCRSVCNCCSADWTSCWDSHTHTKIQRGGEGQIPAQRSAGRKSRLMRTKFWEVTTLTKRCAFFGKGESFLRMKDCSGCKLSTSTCGVDIRRNGEFDLLLLLLLLLLFLSVVAAQGEAVWRSFSPKPPPIFFCENAF